ncbi:MAG TPA: helix-turn-helix transcriptional regulator [Candidatus Elarobacter sp.]|nr:helix-turn-helix transcriptional regulator [Candidatus Elarobacter sp.]
MRAWFAGAFERCLELCAAARPRDAESKMHVALITARALLRLERPDEALTALRDAAAIPCKTDEAMTVRMLTGAAYVRRGDVERGLDVLVAAQADAVGGHRTIRSEIALNIALAQYGRGRFDDAERALNAVEFDSDIVFARALEYRGWIAFARGDSARATTFFVGALQELDRCRHYDRFLEVACIRSLAHLAVERLDRRAWSIVEERRARMEWPGTQLATARFWITYCAATFASDVQGNLLAAAREAREAERIAPTQAYRVQAQCKRAAVARCASEPLSQRDHVDAAAEVYAALKPSTLAGDEAIIPLILAEELANAGCASEARSAFDTFVKISRASPLVWMRRWPTTYAYQRLVEAHVLECGGERRTAIRRYREAFDLYVKLGYKRRAITAALRLARLNAAPDSGRFAEIHTRRLPAQSWLRREAHAAKDRTLRLTAVQREVLGLICQGKSNPDIARSRKRSLHTIRNLVARLFVIFAVSSREELAVECVRRGLYAPK